jgi:hypothetical protein
MTVIFAWMDAISGSTPGHPNRSVLFPMPTPTTLPGI